MLHREAGDQTEQFRAVWHFIAPGDAATTVSVTGSARPSAGPSTCSNCEFAHGMESPAGAAKGVPIVADPMGRATPSRHQAESDGMTSAETLGSMRTGPSKEPSAGVA